MICSSNGWKNWQTRMEARMGKPQPVIDPAELERSARELEVKLALLRLGVGRAQIIDLVEKYHLERIERQLAWLPLRGPRKPSSLIVSAIKEDYEEPAAALEPTAT